MAGLIDFGITQPGSANAFAAGFNQAEQNRNALLQQQQQRQMADIQLKNALREQAQAEAESQAWQAGAGNPQTVLQELQQRGLGKQAMALQTQLTKSQADKIAMLKGTTELMKSAATSIFTNPTLENAVAVTQAFGQRTGSDVSSYLQQLQSLGNNPEAIKQWAAGHAMEADKLFPKFQHFDQGAAIVTGTVDPLTGKFVQGQAYQKAVTPGEAERIGLERQRVGLEGQRLGLEGRRVAIAEKGLEAIPPKEMQKREADYPTATAAITGHEEKAAAFIKDLEKLRDDPGLSQITGAVYGRTPSVSASGSRAQALYDKIVAKGGFQVLQDLRAASRIGGALGNISNQEGKQLIQSFAAIDRRQSTEDVKAAIDQAIDDIKGATARMRNAYDMTYSYKSGEGAKAAPKAPAPAANLSSLSDAELLQQLTGVK